MKDVKNLVKIANMKIEKKDADFNVFKKNKPYSDCRIVSGD